MCRVSRVGADGRGRVANARGAATMVFDASAESSRRRRPAGHDSLPTLRHRCPHAAHQEKPEVHVASPVAGGSVQAVPLGTHRPPLLLQQRWPAAQRPAHENVAGSGQELIAITARVRVLVPDVPHGREQDCGVTPPQFCVKSSAPQPAQVQSVHFRVRTFPLPPRQLNGHDRAVGVGVSSAIEGSFLGFASTRSWSTL